MAVKRVQEKRFSRETTNLDTLNVDGIVLTNVGYKSLLDTAESRHFCIDNTSIRKGPFIATQLNSTQLDVELSCVAINGP